MDVPAAETDAAGVGGMGHAGIGANDPVAGSLEIEAATGATKRAGGQAMGHTLSPGCCCVCDVNRFCIAASCCFPPDQEN